MARVDPRNRVLPAAGSGQQRAVALGLDDFVEPDDQGLSLNELSQAYAALLSKGADPYSDTPGPATEQPIGIVPLDEDIAPVATSDQDAGFAVTPKSILEAILFVGHPTGEPLTSERIASLMRGVRPTEIDDLVRELNAEYASSETPYSIHSIGPGYQLALLPEFGPLRDTFHGRIREARLSQAAIDVLAIVGYHQPVAADEIDRLRGKPSGAILSQLVRRDLLAIERPAEKKAKPQYRTTSRFLDLFGLDDLAELPRSHDLDREL
ncbi:MAG TPA: SMC-Scp complex subunit ScpB [Pirellulaceae bacterium]|nr:SMC-Scp complex subunit ScpB [Pirellulaceae bacterium]